MTYRPFEDYKVPWPASQVGAARIEVFDLDEETVKFESLRMLVNGWGARLPKAGTYRKLIVNNTLVMSDTPAEIADHRAVWRKAEMLGGDVLLNGLGLGVVLRGLLLIEQVRHVDVVEINPDVIALIGPHIADPRVTIHQADAWTVKWPTEKRWNVAWHDIWPTLCTDDLAEHRRMKFRYTNRVAWQECWGNDFLKAEKRRDRRRW